MDPWAFETDARGNIGQMDRNDSIRMTASKPFGYCRAPIPTMCSKALVPELFCHQAGPQIMRVKNHSMLCGLIGKTKARQVGYHNIECILCSTAERYRIGEPGNYFHESQE